MGYFAQKAAFAFVFCCVWVTGLDPSLVSPCPNNFIYRFQDLGKNTWYGSIFITSDSDSYIIQNIRILLDSQAESLKIYDHKNPQVTVDTLDNTEFLVEGLNVKVRKTNTFQLTISVKYKRENIPKLTAYRINEFTTCSKTPTVVGINHTPAPATTSFRPTASGVGSGPWTSRPSWVNPQPAPLPTPMSEVQCGTRIQAPTPLIVGGRVSDRGAWPWHGALFSQEGIHTQYRCGASLVTRRDVVTAAHCVCLHQRSEQPIDASQLLIVFGRVGLNDWGDADSQSRRGARVIVYDGYNSTNYRNDIAIIRCLWPWHGALFSQEGISTQYRCGASLVTRRDVVTAAHCVCLHQRSEQPIDASQLLIVFGRVGLNDWGDADSQSRRGARVIVYDGYNSTNYRNDIAIIRLDEPVKLTPFVRPICLWAESSDIKLLLRTKGTVVGWGYTATGKTSEMLQHAEIPVIDHFECLGKKHEFYSQYLSAKSFCAGAIATENSKVHQACNGDSGGGLVFAKPGTDVWQLRGVVSLAPYDRDADRCDIKLYMVFTDVAYFLDWIYLHIGKK